MGEVIPYPQMVQDFAHIAIPRDSGGGPPYDGGMEARFGRIEDRLDKVETRLGKVDDRLDKVETRLGSIEFKVDEFTKHYATKADLSDMKSSLVQWMVGTSLAIAAAGITVMAFVLNNAVPKAPATPAAQPAPIIINVPSAASPAPAPAAPASAARP